MTHLAEQSAMCMRISVGVENLPFINILHSIIADLMCSPEYFLGSYFVQLDLG